VYKIALNAAQLAFCFMLIHIQLRFPVARAQTKSSYRLFSKLAK